jgi:hypothetical protein
MLPLHLLHPLLRLHWCWLLLQLLLRLCQLLLLLLLVWPVFAFE